MTYTILITCVGGELSPHVIRTLKASSRHELRVVGVDLSENAQGRHFVDRFATVPRGEDPGYVEAIAQVVANERVDLILPTSDEEALALAEDADQLGCMLACVDIETLRTFNDKGRTYERLAELGLPVPDWQPATSVEELETALDQLLNTHGEAVVKPSLDRGGRGVYVVRQDVSGEQLIAGGREVHLDAQSFRENHLTEAIDALPLIVMQRLVEPVHDIDMLAWEGRPIWVVPRRRVDSVLPNEGHTVVDNEELISLGQRLIEAFSLSWLYDCDVMYDAAGNPGVLEINPRPSGSIAASIAAGVPLLDDLISLAKGEAVDPGEIPTGQVVVPFKSLAPVTRR